MNFTAKLSYRKKISFVYDSGEIRSTQFTQVSHCGDDYILAKSSSNGFYSVLDLNGMEKDATIKVLHRFKNGFLLTYRSYPKSYKSSDSIEYFINYNIYGVLNYSTGKFYVIDIVQSDEIKDLTSLKIIYNKDVKGAITSFANPLYCFKDFIFSEIFDDQYILTARPLMANPLSLKLKGVGDINFDVYFTKRIWSAIDIFDQMENRAEIDVTDINIADVTFEQAETDLIKYVSFPESVEEKLDIDRLVNKKSNFGFITYKSIKKKNKWHQMLTNLRSFVQF